MMSVVLLLTSQHTKIPNACNLFVQISHDPGKISDWTTVVLHLWQQKNQEICFKSNPAILERYILLLPHKKIHNP